MNRLLIVAIAVSFGLASARADDVKDLNGNWVPSEGQVGGEKASDQLIKSIKLSISDSNYSVNAGGLIEKGTLSIDAKKKPATMDISPEDGPNKGKKLLAIYELSGDALKICYKLDGGERPKDFTTTKDDKQLVLVYKRQK